MKRNIFCLLLLFLAFHSFSQTKPRGKGFRISSSHSMFPDSLRNAQPRVYNGKIYNANLHYSDSSIFIYVPKHFNKKKPYSFVCWFHGWSNNIDSALQQFQLLQQFDAAHRNAIFVFPEGPKNAPDSYGGKLEKNNEFIKLIKDIFEFLVGKNLVDKMEENPSVSLCGHSGAYRVIGKIFTANPQLNIHEIILFDALYGEMESYQNFIKKGGQFIDIYTDSGGTKQNSIYFMHQLDSLHISYLHKEEDELTASDLKINTIVFLHSKKEHNEVIKNKENFERFLRNRKNN